MKAYYTQALSLDVQRDADIILRLEGLKKQRRASGYVKAAIREKMAREEQDRLRRSDVTNA